MRPLRVLVVDDTDSIRKLVRRLLETEHAEVVGEAGDGAEAVQRVEQLQPDLVIMDYNMPVRGGVSATQEIKARWPHVEVLGYSSTPYQEETENLLAAGATETFDKLHLDELVEAVKTRLPQSSTSRTRLLIVDDDVEIRSMLSLRLQMTNVDVVGEAGTGAEAIDKTEELRPQVIVMDLKMPEMDGIQATREIKARWPKVTVIGYTAFAATDLKQAGADATFQKTEEEGLIEAILDFG